MSLAGRLTLELPSELASYVERKVRSGAFVDAGGVALEALQQMRAQEGELERILREEIPAMLKAIDADPSRLTPLDAAFDELEALWADRR